MRRPAGTAVQLGVVAFQQDEFVGLHLREIDPAMVRAVAGAVDFADPVLVFQVHENHVVVDQRLGVADAERNFFDCAFDRAPDIHIDIAFLQRRRGLVGGQQISDALRRGQVGVVVVDHMYRLAQLVAGAGVFVGHPKRVVKDEYPRRAGGRRHDLLDFGVVNALDLA